MYEVGFIQGFLGISLVLLWGLFGVDLIFIWLIYYPRVK